MLYNRANLACCKFSCLSAVSLHKDFFSTFSPTPEIFPLLSCCNSLAESPLGPRKKNSLSPTFERKIFKKILWNH